MFGKEKKEKRFEVTVVEGSQLSEGSTRCQVTLRFSFDFPIS